MQRVLMAVTELTFFANNDFSFGQGVGVLGIDMEEHGRTFPHLFRTEPATSHCEVARQSTPAPFLLSVLI